jgi:L-seryl-tRNA(Ser) seleniumtransferase
LSATSDNEKRLRDLPAVDRLATRLARELLAERRAELLAGSGRDDEDLVARAAERLQPSLRRVLNATGVVLHTNLGRAPLSLAARAAVATAAAGYSNLEIELSSGRRGSRHEHVEGLVRELTGAGAAIAVNNCAAATLLAVAALSRDGGEVIVSRGQLVEIGGGFRIPEVVAQAGATLVEVGTTNRTRLADYAAAITPATTAILRVHQSNFRTVGFVEEASLAELCSLGIPVIDDVGSGVLAAGDGRFAGEPAVVDSLAAGAAVVAFSGDKLLGGPQAGVLAGERAAIAACRRHPLARAMRIDKLSLAALAATLELHRDPELASAIPALAMLGARPEQLRERAERLARTCGCGEVVAVAGRAGGGSLPVAELRGYAVALESAYGADELAARLRRGDPPLLARIERERVLLDVRTLADEELEPAAAAARAALA